VRDRLQQLVAEMVDKGIRYEEARREFDRHFLTSVVSRCQGNLGRAAAVLGVHRNTLTRRLQELRIKR
jgi:DNA-binding NtrC family response regulator